MTRHLVTLHCGRQIMALNRGQRYCNKQCAAFFSTRRNFTKRQKGKPTRVPASIHFDSMNPVWDTAKRYLTSSGYWILRLKLRTGGRTISKFEHVLIWERCNKCTVPEGWVVHHINENPLDNAPSNLVAMPKGLHRELHAQLDRLKHQFNAQEYAIERSELTTALLIRSRKLDDLRRQWRLKED